MEIFYKYGHKYDFKEIIFSLVHPQKGFEKKYSSKYYTHSPIETLYLKIVQHEYIGNINDIDFINDIKKDYVYNVPSELIEEMKGLFYNPVDLDTVEEYIEENALRLSKYVYLGAEINKEDVRRIRNSKEKVSKLISFFFRSAPSLNIKDVSNELHIISCLQAIILDDKNEVFKYTFHGYQNYSKRMPQVQAALKNDNYTYQALQVYWVRKVSDHFYANIGKYDIVVKVRELEKAINHVLIEILSRPNLDEMWEMHEFYLYKIDKRRDERNRAIQSIINYLKNKGFKYIDHYNNIRYAFFNTYEMDIIRIIKLINNTIEAKEPLLQITIPFDINSDNNIIFNLELAFDYQNNICTLQRVEFIQI